MDDGILSIILHLDHRYSYSGNGKERSLAKSEIMEINFSGILADDQVDFFISLYNEKFYMYIYTFLFRII